MSRPGPKPGDGRTDGRVGPVGGSAALVGTGQRGNALSKEKLAVVLAICERVASGERITDVLGKGRPTGWPSWQAFGKWQAEYPAIRDAYRTARELSAQTLEDKALKVAEGLIAEGAEYTGVFVQGAGKAMEQFRWSAERRDPGGFGTKATAQTIVPIQINTTLDLGQPGGGSFKDAGNPFSFTIDIPDAKPQEPAETLPELEGPVEPPEPPTPPTGFARLKLELPDEAAKFGLTEWPASAMPRKPGGRPPKRRGLLDENGVPRTGPTRARLAGTKPKGYAAERIAALKAEAKARATKA
jgi:hypothetical protein